VKVGDIVASKYRLIARIGQGGMGSVWKAVNTLTGREFAIKFLLAAVAAHEDSRSRFTQEARGGGGRNHPNPNYLFDHCLL
jgi:serine/threonine protein kinase